MDLKILASQDGSYSYDGNGKKIEKGQKFIIIAKDIYGATRTRYYTSEKDSSKGGSGGGGSSDYSTVSEVSLEPKPYVQFLKSDKTKIDIKQEGNRYYNENNNEVIGKIIVRITYDRRVTITKEMEENGWNLTSGTLLEKTFLKSAEETVKVTSVENNISNTITIGVYTNATPPQIKIDGQKVNTDLVKDRTENTETVEEYEPTQTYVLKDNKKGIEVEITDENLNIEINDGKIVQNAKNKSKIELYILRETVIEENGKKEVVQVPFDYFGNEDVKITKTQKENAFKFDLLELGIYQLKVTNEGGIDVTICFQIISDGSSIVKNTQTIKITPDGKTIITYDPNSTKTTFRNELELNFKSDILIKDKGNKQEEEENNEEKEDFIKTGMKLVIGNVEYDIVVSGDLDGDGKVELTDYCLAEAILAINGGKEISLENSEWNFEFDIDDIKGDIDGNGKIDKKDVELLKEKLDVNEDGTFDEKDTLLIKYALDMDGNGVFNKEDINILKEKSLDDLDEEEDIAEDDTEDNAEESQEENENTVEDSKDENIEEFDENVDEEDYEDIDEEWYEDDELI